MTETPNPDTAELATLHTFVGGPAVTADADQLLRLADQAKARDVITIEDGRRFVVVTAEGQQAHEYKVDPEQWLPEPTRKRGTVRLTNADSFVEYVNRHSDPIGTTLWSDIDNASITAVLDDHIRDDDMAGWGQHRAVMMLKRTADWRHWLALDGKYVDQRTFAEHIEDGVDAIHTPSPADMLEVAQTFHAKSGANFVSSQALGGDIEFRFEETVKAKAGQTGALEVPQTFTLAITPFEGGTAAYPLTARFRYRLNDGTLSLGYRLIRPDRVLESAFGDIVRTVSGGADLPVMAGTPRPS